MFHVPRTNIHFPLELLNRFGVDQNVEQCMVLVGVKQSDQIAVEDGIIVPNRADEPAHHFKVKRSDVPEDVLGRVIGVAHTHLPRHASGASYGDVRAIREGMLGVVWHQRSGTVTFYSRKSGFIGNTNWRRREGDH